MCENCNRCWFENSIGLYMCGYWSSDEEIISIDCIPELSFKNGECIFCDSKDV